MYPAPRDPLASTPASVSDVRELLRPPPTPAFSSVPPAATETVTVTVSSNPADASRVLADATRHRLLFVLHATVTLSVGGVATRLDATDAIWIPPELIADALTAPAGAQVVVLGASWNGAAPEARNPIHDAAGRLRELAQWLQMERQTSFPGADAYRSALLELMVREWQRLATDETGALEKRLRSFVLEHLDRPLTLEQLARHLGMGRYHLCRKYREVTGMSPMHAVRAVRIEQALELIRGTSMPMRLIARQVGLRSEQHLSRLLRLHFDVGARKLRRQSAPEAP
jgi:AraC-like DNA-binding protein